MILNDAVRAELLTRYFTITSCSVWKVSASPARISDVTAVTMNIDDLRIVVDMAQVIHDLLLAD